MDTQNRTGSEELEPELVSDDDVLGSALAIHVIELVGGKLLPDASAETLAAVLEAVAEGLADSAALLRRWGVR